MMKLVLLACVAALALAADPPRPQPGSEFESGLYVEIKGPDGEFNGDGFMAWSPSNNKALRDYKLRHKDRIEHLYVFELARNDLGNVYLTESADKDECRVRTVSGNLPGYFDWLSEAKFIGIDYFKGIQIDLWEAAAPGFAIRLGVQAPYYNTPFVMWEVARGLEKVTQFEDFTVNATINQKYFDVPRKCQDAKNVNSPSRTLPKAEPTRPVIANEFYAEVQIESTQGDHYISGEGIFAYDYKKNKAVDDQKLHGSLKTVKLYELQRFDLGQIYEIDDLDSGECKMRVVSGHIPAPWDWLKKAEYRGQDLFRHAIVDLWVTRFGGNELELGVLEGSTTTPLFTKQRGPGFELVNVFNKFTPNPPLKGKYFDVPNECGGASVAKPVAIPHFKFTKV